jgi:hypothetical protein
LLGLKENMKKTLTTAFGAVLFSSLLLASNTAQADVRVRVGGSIHVGGGFSVGVGRFHRPHVWRAGPVVSGAVVWGGSYQSDYYPGGYQYPQVQPAPVVPSYYPYQTYQPVYGVQSSQPSPPPPALPRFALGVFAGGVSTDNDQSGEDIGLLARLRVTPRLLIEAELGKARMAEGKREDRRVEGALAYETSPYRNWSPYLTGGLGVQQANVGQSQSEQRFAELGAGLRLNLGTSLQLLGDIRLGQRALVNDSPSAALPVDASARQISPAVDQPENYSRVRIAAVLAF